MMSPLSSASNYAEVLGWPLVGSCPRGLSCRAVRSRGLQAVLHGSMMSASDFSVGGLPLTPQTAREQTESENRRIRVLVLSEGLFEILRFKEAWELEVGHVGHLIHYVGGR